MAFNYHKELYHARQYYKQLEPVLQKPQTMAFTMLVMSLFTIAFFGFFAIRPTLATITALRREIEDDRGINEQFDQKIEALIKAQESYQTIQPQLPLILASIPEESHFTLLIQQIETLTTAYGATLSALHFQPLPLAASSRAATDSAVAKQLSKAEPFSFSISLEGTYSQLRKFIEELITLNRLIIIKQIDMAVVGNGQLRLSLSLESFYLH